MEFCVIKKCPLYAPKNLVSYPLTAKGNVKAFVIYAFLTFNEDEKKIYVERIMVQMFVCHHSLTCDHIWLCVYHLKVSCSHHT